MKAVFDNQQQDAASKTMTATSSSDEEIASEHIERPKSFNSTTPRGLSMTSGQYDRDNKGYLDETEQALRKMDSQNLGYLSVEKMYTIMDSLQGEQKKSAELIAALQKTQHKAINLKRAVIALCAFSVLLALANIGTSFAAARLAKDTSVDYETGELLVKGTAIRVATTARLVEISIDMQPYDNSTETRRRLVSSSSAAASSMADGSTDAEEDYERRLANICPNGSCTVQGLIDSAQAEEIYQQFCPNWSKDNPNAPCGGGVPQLTLRCRTGTSTLYGAPWLASPPTTTEYGVVFPKSGRGYKARQLITPQGAGLGTRDCGQDFTVGMDCTFEPCLVMAAWDSVCDRPVKICGPGGAYR